MTETTQNRSAQPDDIDLLQLAERSILFFKKYKWVFLIAILLGIGFGFYLYKKIAVTYKSRMLVHSFMLSNPEEIQIVSTWDQLLKRKEYDVLAGLFNCDKNTLFKTKQIRAKELQQVFTPTNPNGFTIDATVTDNAVLDDLQNGIVYGFENSEYTKERLMLKRNSLQELIDKTNAEIQRLDSARQTLEKILTGKERSSSSLIVDGFSVNKQLVDMNEKLQSFKEQLRYTSAVQVLQGFQKFNIPAGPHLIPLIVIGLVLFLVIAYIYALISSIRVSLKKRATNKVNQ